MRYVASSIYSKLLKVFLYNQLNKNYYMVLVINMITPILACKKLLVLYYRYRFIDEDFSTKLLL